MTCISFGCYLKEDAGFLCLALRFSSFAGPRITRVSKSSLILCYHKKKTRKTNCIVTVKGESFPFAVLGYSILLICILYVSKSML